MVLTLAAKLRSTMKTHLLIVSSLLFALGFGACHSSKKLAGNSGLFNTLRAELNPNVAILHVADTINVIYPELTMFDFGKDEIKAEARQDFVRFANILKQYPAVRIQVNGYTDNVGTDEVNTGLSRRRATKAYNLLSDNGVDATRMNTTGYGSKNPIQTNATDAGRAANRRVEFILYQAAK